MPCRSSLHQVLIGFVTIGALTLGGCNLFVSDGSRMEKAVRLRDQGDLRSAAIEAKKVLKANPENRDARLLLGEISLVIGEPAAAEKELRRARDLGVPNERVMIPLGRALLIQGRFDRALEELNVNALGESQGQKEVLLLRGQTFLAMGKLAEADQMFRQALARDQDAPDARIGLALVEQRKGNLRVAEEYIAETLSRNPDYARAWLAKGELELGRGQYAEAEAAFSRALSLHGIPVVDEFIALNGLAESQWRQGNSHAAVATVEKMLALKVHHPRPKYLRALIAYGAGDYTTAKSSLHELLRDFPEYRPATLLLGATHYAQGELEQADVRLTSVLANDPGSVSARKLLAATRLQQHNPQEAVAMLTPVLTPDTDDNQLLALMGKASMDIGDAKTGVVYLERVAEMDPSNQGLRLQLAAGYVSVGDTEHAIKLLERIPETREGAYGRELLLVLAYLRKHDYDAAAEQARKLVARRPDDAGAQNLAGNVFAAGGQLRRAREYFDRALQLQPENVVVLLSLGRLDLREGKQDSARARFERALALSPNNVNAMVALAQLSALRDDQAGVGEWLERAAVANPQATDLKLLLIRHYLRQGNRERARNVAIELERVKPLDAEVQNALGVVHMAEGNVEMAIASLRKATATAPTSADYLYNLARAELMRQRREEAKKLLTQCLELRSDHIAATATLAVIEMQEGKAYQALARARALQQSKNGAIAGQVLEGDLHMMQRRFDSAARAYGATSEQGQDGMLALKSYQARAQARMPNATEPLEAWLSKHPDDVRVRLALAEADQAQGRLRQAAANYQLVLERHPDSTVALNNLAWLYHIANDPRALEFAERAYRLEPRNGAIADTLGWLLVQQGQTQRGVELLRKAVEQAPDVPEIQYHLGVALARSGAKEEARSTLANLVNSGQSFKDMPKAKELLQQL